MSLNGMGRLTPQAPPRPKQKMLVSGFGITLEMLIPLGDLSAADKHQIAQEFLAQYYLQGPEKRTSAPVGILGTSRRCAYCKVLQDKPSPRCASCGAPQ